MVSYMVGSCTPCWPCHCSLATLITNVMVAVRCSAHLALHQLANGHGHVAALDLALHLAGVQGLKGSHSLQGQGGVLLLLL